jgi:ubiquitin-protein ligase
MKFNTKVNLPSVNQANGKIENCPLLKQWKPTTTLDAVLQSLKQ